ncbi:hypothetical protein [Nocardia flavorosea]|uniref:Uncharacterized protein n=1 Tax=Nocardia flavorosea TaxID=53429 RepID=A0A846YJV7_9NOCA|nr:hypothetical protein [Nocardia flavorosea]NKY57408.1 hypothetical protein [Nocardia flavorosea]
MSENPLLSVTVPDGLFIESGYGSIRHVHAYYGHPGGHGYRSEHELSYGRGGHGLIKLPGQSLDQAIRTMDDSL